MAIQLSDSLWTFVFQSLLEPQKYADGFDPIATHHYFAAHIYVPVLISAGYLVVIFGGQAFMKASTPFDVRGVVKIWNLILAVFSIVGSFIVLPDVAHRLYHMKGWQAALCDDPIEERFYVGYTGLWGFYFVVSKIPELMDTVFLVLQKKPVILLHWFHHFTTMCYCWHAFASMTTTGLYFAAMNYAVHSLMYSYYFLMCFSTTRPFVKKFNQVITTLQIVQMIVGILISCIGLGLISSMRAPEKQCPGLPRTNTTIAAIMYISYFVLFAMFYKKTYFSKTKTSQEKEVAKTKTA